MSAVTNNKEYLFITVLVIRINHVHVWRDDFFFKIKVKSLIIQESMTSYYVKILVIFSKTQDRSFNNKQKLKQIHAAFLKMSYKSCLVFIVHFLIISVDIFISLSRKMFYFIFIQHQIEN